MKHLPMATANAAAVTVAIIYIVCAGAFIVAPEFAMSIGKSWFHGIDLSAFSAPEITVSSFLLGIVTATAGAWLVGYVFATAYNTFLKK